MQYRRRDRFMIEFEMMDHFRNREAVQQIRLTRCAGLVLVSLVGTFESGAYQLLFALTSPIIQHTEPGIQVKGLGVRRNRGFGTSYHVCNSSRRTATKPSRLGPSRGKILQHYVQNGG